MSGKTTTSHQLNEIKPAPAEAVSGPSQNQVPPNRTVAHMFGEIVWLLSQSPLHKHFAIADLEWMVMPPVGLKQFHVFYEGERVIAAVFWGFLSEAVEQRLLVPHARMRPDEWRSGDRLWLVELVAPSATPENQVIGRMLTDLSKTVFEGRSFKFLSTDITSGKRTLNQFSLEGGLQVQELLGNVL